MAAASLFFNLLSLPTDLASIYLLYELVGSKKRWLFLGVMLVQTAFVRLLRVLAGSWIAPIGIPVAFVIALALGEGARRRKALLFALFAVLYLIAELHVNALYHSIAGATGPDAAICGRQLDAIVTAQMAVVATLIVAAWTVGPFARRFRNEVPLTQVKREELALVPFALGQALATYANVALRYLDPVVETRYLLSEVLMMVLFLLADMALVGEVNAYSRQSENQMRAELLTRVADSFMRHYRDIEARIVQTGKLRHDLRNQLQTADVLVSEGKMGEARALLGDLASALSEGEAATHVSVLMSKELAESFRSSLQEGDAKGDAPKDYKERRLVGPVPFVVSQVAALVVFVWHVPMFVAFRWPLYVGVAALVVWFISDPLFFKLMRRAREADISQERVRVAQEFLDARRQMGLHLEREAQEAEELRRQMCANVDELEGLLAKGRTAEFHERVVGERGLSLGSTRYCENSVADALTRVKADAARRLGVRFETELDIPERLALPPLELCTVLSNVYDNAIKGAAAAPRGRRWVHVGAKVAAGYLMVLCRNGCAGDIGTKAPSTMQGDASDDGGLRASRPGVQEHGWGLKILSEVADRLGGTFKISVEDGVFITRVTVKAEGGSSRMILNK